MSERLNPVVLVVDDDPGDRELTRRALAHGDIQVDLRMAFDGEAALAYLRREGAFATPEAAPRPDLVVLDLNMPGLDGWQILAEIRRDPNLRRIPIVVMTHSRQEEDIVRSYDLGCNTFVRKPMEVDEFMRSIRQLGCYWFDLARLPTR